MHFLSERPVSNEIQSELRGLKPSISVIPSLIVTMVIVFPQSVVKFVL